jgi:hypothetical protein
MPLITLDPTDDTRNAKRAAVDGAKEEPIGHLGLPVQNVGRCRSKEPAESSGIGDCRDRIDTR